MEITCVRCGYIWVPHKDTEDLPSQCANVKCRTYYWDRPTTLKRKVVNKQEVVDNEDYVRECLSS